MLSALSVVLTEDNGDLEPLWAQRPLIMATPATMPILLAAEGLPFSPLPLPPLPPHARPNTSPNTSDNLSGTLPEDSEPLPKPPQTPLARFVVNVKQTMRKIGCLQFHRNWSYFKFLAKRRFSSLLSENNLMKSTLSYMEVIDHSIGRKVIWLSALKTGKLSKREWCSWQMNYFQRNSITLYYCWNGWICWLKNWSKCPFLLRSSTFSLFQDNNTGNSNCCCVVLFPRVLLQRAALEFTSPPAMTWKIIECQLIPLSRTILSQEDYECLTQ